MSLQYEVMRTIYVAVMGFSVLCVVIIAVSYFIFNSWFRPLIDRKNRV
jgi:sensor histidine kinase YesM